MKLGGLGTRLDVEQEVCMYICNEDGVGIVPEQYICKLWFVFCWEHLQVPNSQILYAMNGKLVGLGRVDPNEVMCSLQVSRY